MRWNAKGTGWKIAAIVLLSGVALMVAAQQVSSLIVSGQQGQAKVVQVQGANYVEVNGLARLTGGSISFTVSYGLKFSTTPWETKTNA